MPNIDYFRRFASKVSIAHHIPGRIRLKLGAIELDAQGRQLLEQARQFQNALDDIRGVNDIRLNVLARSCTIEYDPKIIPAQAWPDLLAGVESPAADALLGIIGQKYEEVLRA